MYFKNGWSFALARIKDWSSVLSGPSKRTRCSCLQSRTGRRGRRWLRCCRNAASSTAAIASTASSTPTSTTTTGQLKKMEYWWTCMPRSGTSGPWSPSKCRAGAPSKSKTDSIMCYADRSKISRKSLTPRTLTILWNKRLDSRML